MFTVAVDGSPESAPRKPTAHRLGHGTARASRTLEPVDSSRIPLDASNTLGRLSPVTSPATLPARAAPPGPWIVGRSYDLGWFFGGALLSLLALGLYLVGVSSAAIFWVWTLAVDGPHIAATLTRTYPDREARTKRRGLFWLSLLAAVAIGPLFLAAEVAGAKGAFELFLGAVALYAYHHVIRQHYGFLALYRAKAGERSGATLDKWCLYLGCWAPYLVMLLVHPSARPLLGLAPELDPLSKVAAGLGVAVFVGATVTFVLASLRREGASTVKLAYVGLVLPLYGLCYLGFAWLEPTHPNPTTPDQAFLLITVMISIMHGFQYVGLVWFHNRNRYSRAGDFGWGRSFGRLGLYAGGLIVFSLTIYLASAAAAGVFPWLAPTAGRSWGPVRLDYLGLCVWWGIALHHYLVDQYIWRIKGDAGLAADLGLRPLPLPDSAFAAAPAAAPAPGAAPPIESDA